MFTLDPATVTALPTLTDTHEADGVLAPESYTAAAQYARWIRDDLKAAAKTCALLRGVKVSVTSDRYSMGQSVTVTLAPSWRVLNPAKVYAEGRDFRTRTDLPVHNARADRLVRWVAMAARLYLRDRSDSLTDYYNVNFALSVDIDGLVESAEREALWAEHDRPAVERIAVAAVEAVETRGLLTDDRPALALDALRDGDLAECVRLAEECARETGDEGATALLATTLAAAARRGLDASDRNGPTCRQRFMRILTLCGEARDAAWARVNELAA